MTLRGELLAAAIALRDRVLADLSNNPELRHVARYEHGLIVGKLQSGQVVRLSRDELPRDHPEHWRGRGLDVLALAGEDELTTVIKANDTPHRRNG